MIEKSKAIKMLEDMNHILDKKNWNDELREKINQYKKELGVSFKAED